MLPSLPMIKRKRERDMATLFMLTIATNPYYLDYSPVLATLSIAGAAIFFSLYLGVKKLKGSPK